MVIEPAVPPVTFVLPAMIRAGFNLSFPIDRLVTPVSAIVSLVSPVAAMVLLVSPVVAIVSLVSPVAAIVPLVSPVAVMVPLVMARVNRILSAGVCRATVPPVPPAVTPWTPDPPMVRSAVRSADRELGLPGMVVVALLTSVSMVMKEIMTVGEGCNREISPNTPVHSRAELRSSDET